MFKIVNFCSFFLPVAQNLTEKERGILVDQLALWNSLRHDLERARLLIELVRKREKLKREKLRLLMTIGELQLRPLNLILRKSLERIARKDPAAIFANPVTVKDVSVGGGGREVREM